jgi:hypothetical protein
VALALALQNDHFEEFSRMALGIFARFGLDKHLLAHQEDDGDVIARGEEPIKITYICDLTRKLDLKWMQ